jgi:peptide chain release factor 2
VRISPFGTGTRETSFASLFVSPEIDENIEVEVNDKDLRVDTFRATGAGGQHINTTDSAVRITHLPTGIVVGCQNQRSQHQNRAVAMQVLRSRLYELELEKRRAETAVLEANKADISFGSQIRNYVLAPYRMVKDARTKVERGDVDAVLSGDIDDFIKAYLLSRRAA